MSSGVAPLTPSTTLLSRLWPAQQDARLSALRAAVLILLGTALLTVSAKIQVPFPPVPMTLQTLVVLVIGAAYGWRLGGATVGLYLVEGALGLPVFAGPVAGPLYMAGPTGGFLAGFLAAVVVTGVLAERGWNGSPWRVLALMALGHAVIFACGLAWLSALMPFATAWQAGVAPFAVATLVKTALAAALVQVAWAATRQDGDAR
ncbi:MAG TPA: biotin transporter BioY [Microvirga sp.]|jgi:biotin transport system substrate-specific component|nr:biotin transporter BioY [Microvirga sp.]